MCYHSSLTEIRHFEYLWCFMFLDRGTKCDYFYHMIVFIGYGIPEDVVESEG